MADALDNLLAAVHLLRTEGGATLVSPNEHRMRIPTPIVGPDLVTLLLALAEGWRIQIPPATEPEPSPALTPAPTTALQPRSTTHRRRRR